MLQHLNKRLAVGPYKVYESGKGSHVRLGEDLYMDRNSLDLFRGQENELPPCCTKIPQFPFCANRHLRMLVLTVTHKCNLGCSYCYLRNLYPEMGASMSFATATKAIDDLFDMTAVSKYKKPAVIGFFGGEPLLMFDLIKEVVSYARMIFDNTVSFTITTNGTLITDEIAQFLAEHDFGIIVSVDGPENIHDAGRPMAGGGGSHASVLRGLEALRKYQCGRRVTLRSTFSPGDKNLLIRVAYLNDLCDQGFAQNVSVEPAALSESPCCDVSGREFAEDFWGEIESDYAPVVDYLIARIKAGKPARMHNIMTYVSRLRLKIPYVTNCGAGVGYITVTPTGSVHACHREMVTKIGDLACGGVCEQDRAKWVENRCLSTDCKNCDFLYICGGPCREFSLRTYGDINRPSHCLFVANWVIAAARIIAETTKEAPISSSEVSV